MNFIRRNLLIFLSFLFFFIFFYFLKSNFFLFQENEYSKKFLKNFEFCEQNVIKRQLINLKNDVISLDVNLFNGSIERANLLKYKNNLNGKKSFSLFKKHKNFIYKFISGIIKVHRRLKSHFLSSHILYKTKSVLFKLKSKKNLLRVYLKGVSKTGLLYTKIFSLVKGSYNVNVTFCIHNNSLKKLRIIPFSELQQTIIYKKKKNFINRFFNLKIYQGPAYSTNKIKYKKHSFETIQKNINVKTLTKIGWIAMIQQYFAVAVIPKIYIPYKIYTKKLFHNIAAIGYFNKIIEILPNSSYLKTESIWIGPKIQKKLVLISKNLDLILDYGWLSFISQPLFNLLNLFHKFFFNWGISIIIITLLMKCLTYPLIKSQYLSTLKIKELQPEIDKIKKNFSNNPGKMSQEIFLLYKKTKINPLSSIIPIILQMPFFLALYYMLISVIELRHAPFVLWIKDLSNYDPLYILPILMGISGFLVQISSEHFHKNFKRKKFTYIVPITLTIFFLWFPSGLVLYYFISNIITVLQQYYIYCLYIKK